MMISSLEFMVVHSRSLDFIDVSLKGRFEFQGACIGDTPRQVEAQSLLESR